MSKRVNNKKGNYSRRKGVQHPRKAIVHPVSRIHTISINDESYQLAIINAIWNYNWRRKW